MLRNSTVLVRGRFPEVCEKEIEERIAVPMEKCLYRHFPGASVRSRMTHESLTIQVTLHESGEGNALEAVRSAVMIDCASWVHPIPRDALSFDLYDGPRNHD